MYQLTFYVPATHVDDVKTAVFAAGAGRFKGYDQCAWQVLGDGQFRPLAGSQPFLGETSRLTTVAEYKVEMVCAEQAIKPVIAALLSTHPYEEPAYAICKILTANEL